MATYEKYEDWNPQPDTIETLEQAKAVILEYDEKGYDLTLRQLYYQLVSKNLIANEEREYNRLGRIVSRGRRAGLLPWDVIEDRERTLYGLRTYDEPSDVIDEAAGRFKLDLWGGQDARVEVWIEKKALQGVINGVCNRWNVDYFPAKGYPSDTAAWNAAQRHIRRANQGQKTIVLHLGDHDPSGIDMTRDIRDRLVEYGARWTVVRRIALNMEQIEEHDPPPNPAKVSDSRYEGYAEEYGKQSWELDALDPELLTSLIDDHIRSVADVDAIEERRELEQEHTETLRRLAQKYDQIDLDE